MLFLLAILSFNSIKVQLRQAICSRQNYRNTFQFHKGTIKAYSGFKVKRNIVNFQFHKGTIKAYYKGEYRYRSLNFQFHKGTIKANLQTIVDVIAALSIP